MFAAKSPRMKPQSLVSSLGEIAHLKVDRDNCEVGVVGGL